MMHDVHPEGDAILWDGCKECERRGEDPCIALTQLDPHRFKRAWERAWQLQKHGLSGGQHAELPLLRALIGVQLNFERLGMHPYGSIKSVVTPPGGSATRAHMDHWVWQV